MGQYGLLPKNLNRDNYGAALFLAGVPAIISLFAGIAAFKVWNSNIYFAVLTTAAAGYFLSVIVSIRETRALFCMAAGCALLTLAAIGVLKIVPELPLPVSLIFLVVNVALFLLGLRLLLEEVMPRAEQLVS